MSARTRIVIGPVAVALAVAVPAGLARAGDRESHLEAAERALDDLDFHSARDRLDAALRSGDNTAASLHRIYLLAGIVDATFGDRKAALRSFEHALAIDPNGSLPEGLAPKITAPFAEARRRTGSRGIAVGCAHSGTSGSVFVTVDSDPLRMVTGAVARYRDGLGGVHNEALPPAHRYVFAVPEEAAGWVQVALVDEHGNQLAPPCEVQAGTRGAQEWDDEKIGDEPAGAHRSTSTGSLELRRSSPRGRRRPLVARWYVWGTLSLGLAAAGAYYGLEAKQSATRLSQAIQDSHLHEFSDAAEIERRGQRQAQISTVAFGAAAGVAAVGVLLWLVTDDEPSDARRAAISAMPTRGGASVGLTFGF